MKTHPLNSVAFGLKSLAAIAVAASLGSANAQLYWQGSSTGITGGASNVLDTTALNWNPASDGSGVKQAFTPSGTNAVFAGTGGGVSLPGTNQPTFGDFQVNSTGYVFGIGTTAGDVSLGLTTFSGSALSSTVFQNNNSTAARRLTLTVTGSTSFNGTMQDGGAFALSVSKAGAGTLTMSGTNTFTGTLSVSAGTLELATNSFSSLAGLSITGSSTMNATGTARTWSGKFVGVNSGLTWTVGGDQNLTFDSLNAATSNFASSSSTTINVNNTATTTFGGTSIGISATASAGNTATIGGSGKVAISAAITNGGGTVSNLEIRNTGGVTLSGVNSFTGNLTIRSGGILNVASLNNASTNGVLGNSANSIFLSNSGTTSAINFTGSSAASTDRQLVLDSAGGNGTNSSTTIRADGTGTVNFAGGLTGSGAAIGAIGRTLNLGGNGTGAGTMGAVVNGTSTGGGAVTVTVNKEGSSVWKFSGSNDYTGKTSINAGTLLINGSHSDANVVSTGGGYGSVATGHFQTANGTTFGGSGSIKGQTNQNNSNLVLATTGSFIAPGSAAGTVGTLTLNGAGVDTSGSKILRMATGSQFNFDLGAGLTSDTISLWNYVNGDLMFNTNTINFANAGINQTGTYRLFSFFSDNGVTATASNISSGLTANFGATGISGNIVYNTNSIDLNVTAIPEPSTWLLLGLGLTTVVVFRRRRRM